MEDLMRDSGLVQVQTKPATASLNLPSASHALEMMREAFGAYRAVVADLSDTEKSKKRGTKFTSALGSLKVLTALEPNSNLLSGLVPRHCKSGVWNRALVSTNDL